MKLGQEESHPAPGRRSRDSAALGACVIITCQDGSKPGDLAAVAWAGGSCFLRVNFCCGIAGSRVRKPPWTLCARLIPVFLSMLGNRLSRDRSRDVLLLAFQPR